MLLTFYHLSDTDLGVKFKLTPRNAGFETSIKRVCVSPTVRECLLAIGGVRGNADKKTFYIYRIEIDDEDKALDMVNPEKMVADHILTREAWILKERMFEKVGVLHRQQWGQYDYKNILFIKEPTFSITWRCNEPTRR